MLSRSELGFPSSRSAQKKGVDVRISTGVCAQFQSFREDLSTPSKP